MSSVGSELKDPDADWTSSSSGPMRGAATSPGRPPLPPTTAGNDVVKRNNSAVIDDEFWDDFDDDDDAFFASTTASQLEQKQGEGLYVKTNNPEGSENYTGQSSSSININDSTTPFGMLAFTYSDAYVNRGVRKNRNSKSRQGFPSSGPPSPPNAVHPELLVGILGLDENYFDEDAELLDFDKQCLVHLRNPSSSYLIVARSCMELNQLVYSSTDSSIGNEKYLPSCDNYYNDENEEKLPPLLLRSSNIYHMQHYYRKIHLILASLSTCLKGHLLSSSRSLAARTLSTIARASYAKLHFDINLTSMHLPSSSSMVMRLQDECGNGVAYTLVMAALEQESEAVSSAALEALGKLTIDPKSDAFASEVKEIAECSNTSSIFVYDQSSLHGSKVQSTSSSYPSMFEHDHAMSELQSNAYNNVIFPRMQKLLTRISTYSQSIHLVKVIPVVTATVVYALSRGLETLPSRRAIETTKFSHGKRGWRETDAIAMANEFVTGVLIPCFHRDTSCINLQRSAASACIRMSSAYPLASWRVMACRCAVSSLLQQLHEEIGSMQTSYFSLNVGLPNTIPGNNTVVSNFFNANHHSIDSYVSTSFCQPNVPLEALAGTAAMLTIALRGVPLQERTAGLISVVRVALFFLPIGVPIPMAGMDGNGGNIDTLISTFETDTPTRTVNNISRRGHRLCRTGLLVEAALSIMLDGDTNIDHLMTREFSNPPTVKPKDEPDKNSDKEEVNGSRAILLNHVLKSKHLLILWDSLQTKFTGNTEASAASKSFHPADELVWVFCTVALQIGNIRQRFISKNTNAAIDWANLCLVLLDNFSKYACNPHHQEQSTIKGTSSSTKFCSPFANAAYKAYISLFVSVLQRSGLSPISTISIIHNMLPPSLPILKYPAESSLSSMNSGLSIIGGPGKQLPRVSRVLSKITNTVLALWNKSRHLNSHEGYVVSAEIVCKNALLAGLIVDTWLGRCIANHDTKQSNEGQLDIGPQLLSLFHSEMDILLDNHNEIDVQVTNHLFRMYIGCVQIVACTSSILLPAAEKKESSNGIAPEKKIAPLALSILSGLATALKEGFGSKEIVEDASSAVIRIQEFIRTATQHHDDIATALQVSPILAMDERLTGKQLMQSIFDRNFIGVDISKHSHEEQHTSFQESGITKLSKPPAIKSSPKNHIAYLFYHHARLVVLNRINNAVKATAPTVSLQVSRLVKPRNALRLGSFSHSTITNYKRTLKWTILLPTQRPYSEGAIEPICLTGCSDPVVLTMSHGVRRIRKTDLREDEILVMTFRLYNITPVPIKNGIRLDLSLSYEDNFDSGSTQSCTTIYSNEIRGGDFVTWECTVGNWRTGNLFVQPSITFREIEQEACTRKWVSLSGESRFVPDDDDASTGDVTITCEPAVISCITSLQPCPLVFFGGIKRCEPMKLGDTAAFRFLWSTMTYSCNIPFLCNINHCKDAASDVLGKVVTSKGCIELDVMDRSKNTHYGYAFVTPEGNRVLCAVLAKESTDENSVCRMEVRSNSLRTLQSLAGTDASKESFLRFVIGDQVNIWRNGTELTLQENSKRMLEHDFPSMVMRHSSVSSSSGLQATFEQTVGEEGV
ncbi:hypothetical protein ACHAXS_010634 [Conticribra weissflogii]